MKQDNDKKFKIFSYGKVIPLLYLLAIVLMAVIVIFNILMRNPKTVSFGLGGFETMNTHWLTSQGEEFKISEIDKLRSNSSDSISIYYQLSDKVAEHQSLVFRSKNCFVKVLVDDRVLYETEAVSAPFYNHSPGTRWNVVNLSPEDAGKKLELKITQAYQDGRAKVDNFYIGDRAAITLHIIQSKAFGFIVSLTIFFVGILFIATWMILNWKRTPRDNSLLWLASFSLIASIWALLETNLFQLFSQNLELIQVTDNMMLVLGGIPLYMYMDSVFHVFRLRTVRILCMLDMAYVLIATALQMLGIKDYHQTLNGAIITYSLTVIILIGCLIHQRKDPAALALPESRFFSTLQRLGVCSLGLGLMADLIRYLSSDVLDRAFCIRIGLLGFLLFFGAGNILQMIQLVQKGLEADFISQLAYQDGLTGFGNRTAYIEKLDHVAHAHKGEPFAFVMFDINNLKWVNDNYGHQAGDALILHCTDLIQQAFPPQWSLYRIGGDEFVALMAGSLAPNACETASAHLLSCIQEFNEAQHFICPIAIAHGTALISNITAERITLAEKEADLKMYNNKYELKAHQKNKGTLQ